MRITLCALALVAFPLFMHAEEPALKVGATIFADYTHASETSSFNVNRAYVNLTGTLNQRFSFRVTPDIYRESGSTGSQQFRLKYAYAQLNLDEWTTRGSFVRFGMQQTPYLDYVEQIYRYRWQGTNFAEREGYLASSDTGVTVRYVLPGEYGDIHGGFYNGEGYSKAETNEEKAFQLRATVRPLPKSPLGKGLRGTVFVTADHYDENASRERLIGQLTYEHARGNAGVEVLSTKDRALEGRGWSAFATPRLGKGWELLLRHDHNEPDRTSDVVRQRNITGLAYWLPGLQKVTGAVMLDRDALTVTGKEDDTRYGVKLLLVF
jgi:Phosphate-selective porin O and P